MRLLRKISRTPLRPDLYFQSVLLEHDLADPWLRALKTSLRTFSRRADLLYVHTPKRRFCSAIDCSGPDWSGLSDPTHSQALGLNGRTGLIT
jgi:hypothetical protein